jgi:hypothetical protein
MVFFLNSMKRCECSYYCVQQQRHVVMKIMLYRHGLCTSYYAVAVSLGRSLTVCLWCSLGFHLLENHALLSA